MKEMEQTMTLLGTVAEPPDTSGGCFPLDLRTGDRLQVWVGPETSYTVLTNLDGMSFDRLPEPEAGGAGKPVSEMERRIKKYIRKEDRIYVHGILIQRPGQPERFEAHVITLLHYEPQKFLFEEHTHWWLSQLNTMADEWLQDLFGDERTYDKGDFSRLYRTNLNIYGGKTDDDIQSMATLSRLIYGLSSAYLLLGDQIGRAHV